MKKIFFIILLTSVNFAVDAQTDLKKKIVDTTCACLTALPNVEKKTQEQLQAAISQCMMQKSMTDFMALAEERNIEMTDMEAMRKLGMEIGMDLMKSDCKAMTAIITKMAEGKIEYKEKDAPATSPSVKGVVQSVTVSDFVYVTVLAGAKSVKLVWSDYVINGNSYASDFTKLKNKNISFSYKSKDVYSPKVKAYITINMISGIKE